MIGIVMTEKNKASEQESEEEIAGRSKRMVDGLNALAEAGIFVGDAVPHPEGVEDFSKWLQMKIVKAERGRVEVSVATRPEMSNPTGLLHGGVQAAIMDSVIGMSSATLGHKGFPITINLVCNFLGKLKIGEEAIIIGEVKREGRSIIHAHATLFDRQGGVVAEGEGNLLKTSYVPDYIKYTDGDEEK